MDWPIFKEHRLNRNACAEHCPLYRGRKPDYDSAHFPGVTAVLRRSIRLGLNEHYTVRDARDIVRAVAKVAAAARTGRGLVP